MSMKKWGTRLKHRKISLLVSMMMVVLGMLISKFMREMEYHLYQRQIRTVAMCDSWEVRLQSDQCSSADR